MNIDRDGLPFIAGAAVPAALLAATGRRRLALPLIGLAGFFTLFFRDPTRRPDTDGPPDVDTVIAPADGKVMVVGTPEPGIAPEGDWQQISIFLSLADVHMNRAPYGGEVLSVEHRPGRYLPAYKDASAAENERSEVWVRGKETGRIVVFRQVVGLLARRVVTRISAGDEISTGQRVGLMKFGSRMDIFVPPDCTVIVTRGDRVRGGETALARWPGPTDASRG